MPTESQDLSRLSDAQLLIFGTPLALFRAILENLVTERQLAQSLYFFSGQSRSEDLTFNRFDQRVPSGAERPSARSVREAYDLMLRVIKNAVEGQRIVWLEDVGHAPLHFFNGLLASHGKPTISIEKGVERFQFNYRSLAEFAWEQRRYHFLWR